MSAGTLLVVDDDPTSLMLVCEVLEAEGYSISRATDAAQALQLLERPRPDLILMDIQMPGMDGLTLTRRLKADPRYAGIPIVAITAFAIKGDEQKALDAGCDGYITKPVDARSLRQRVAGYLAGRAAPAASAAPPGTGAVAAASLAKPKVLAVDDTPANLLAIHKVLEKLPLELITAGSGEEALALVLRHEFAVILLDVRMPGIDGYETAALIRGHTERTPVPIIFVTASASDQAAMSQAYGTGAVDFLLKPINEDLLRSKVGVFLDLYQYRHRLVERRLEHKNAELARAIERLRASEERLSAIINTSPVCIKVVSADGRLVDMNPAGLAMLDATAPEQLYGRPIREVVAPEHRAAFDALQQKVWGGAPGTLEFEAIGLKGSRRWLDTHAVPVRDSGGRVTGLLGITRDISQRKQVEAELRESEAKFRTLFEQASDGFFVSDAQGRYLEVNPAGCRLLGYTRQEILERTIADVVAPEEADRIAPEIARLGGGAVVQSAWQFRRRDGSLFVGEVSAWRLPDGRLQAYLHDVTERRRAEEALRESERRLRDLLSNVPLASVMLDGNGRVLYCNEFLLRLTGWREQEVIGKDWFGQFVPPNAEAAARQVLADLLAGRVGSLQHEHEVAARGGGRRMVRWSHTVLRAPSGRVTGTASIGEDITQRRQDEDAQRRRTEELERYHRQTVGRELQMIELKKQVNALAHELGRAPPYDLSFLERA